MSRRIALDIENELSPRELQLLVHASKGLTDQAIANEIGISLATIATYWGRIRIKLGPLNRTELVARYLEFKSREEIDEINNERLMLREQIETTKADDSYLLQALNKNPFSIIILNPDMTIFYVNEITCRWFGYSQDELVGHPCLNFYPEGRHDLWNSWIEQYFADPANLELSKSRTGFVRHKGGSLIEIIGDTIGLHGAAGVRLMFVTSLVSSQ